MSAGSGSRKSTAAVTRFATPKPITVTVDLFAANVRILASERTETVVEISPRNASKSADVKAAELTRVEYSNGRLLIKGPKQRVRFGIGSSEALDVTIQLPDDSHVNGTTAVGELHGQGRLGECQFRTSAGNIILEQTGPLILQTGSGDIVIDRAAGQLTLSTGAGSVRIREMDGTAVIRNTNGSSHIGEITGDLRVSSAHGSVSIDRVQGYVAVKTANGSVRVNEAVRGSLLLESAHGELAVGVRDGTAVWLDVSSRRGSVHNSLSAGSPRESEQRVEVRARTIHGDILIYRSTKAIDQLRNNSQ